MFGKLATIGRSITRLQNLPNCELADSSPVPIRFSAADRKKLLSYLSVMRCPSVYQTREFAVAGGLMSLGSRQTDQYRAGGGYVGRILKGDSPAELPVQRVTKIELIINLKTAKALGLTVPETLLATADEVIQ